MFAGAVKKQSSI